MKIQLIYLLFLLCIALPLNAQATKNKALQSPYPIILGPAPVGQKCQKTPPAIQDLLYKSVYTNRSHGLSIVDKKAEKKYKKQTKAIRHFENKISHWVESYFENGTNLQCAAQWLVDWAKQDALLKGNANFQGEAVRKWTLASLSSSYSQIRHLNIPAKDKKSIDQWLAKLAEQVVADYSRHPEKKSRQNNHVYWSAWAVMITTTFTNNKDHYNWAKAKFYRAMRDIEKDGTLPLEVSREGKAYNYHVFALSPLIMMAETLEVNGKNGYKPALHRLVKGVMDGLNNEQQYFEEKTGVKQDLKGTITSGHFAWLEVYNARFPNANNQKWLDTAFRPAIQRRIGGNMTRLFEKR